MPMIMIRHFLHIYTITELTIVMDGDSFQDKAKLFLAQSCQETSKVHKHPARVVNDTTYSQSRYIYYLGNKALAIVLRTIAIAIVVKKSIEYCNMQ